MIPGPELNYKNSNYQKDADLSTSANVLHQSQDPNWNKVVIRDVERDVWLKALENIKSLNALGFS